MRAKYKIVFLGDQNVGKTTLISQFVYKEAEETYQPTVGIDFLTKQIEVDDKVVKLQLWDTAGQEKFHSIISSYSRDSFMAIIVFDVTNQQSISKINYWAQNLVRINDTKGEINILLVGNKIDLIDTNELDEMKVYIERVAKEQSAEFIFTSAISKKCIGPISTAIIESIKKDIKEVESAATKTADIGYKINLGRKSWRWC